MLIKRHLISLFPVVCSLNLGGCVGEASVTYKGTVVESESSGYSFDDGSNPSNLPPIPSVRVSLCDASKCKAVSDAQGAWGPVETVFGGSAFSDVKLNVRFEADGFESFVYSTVYEDTKDPTNGAKYLNVKMRRAR